MINASEIPESLRVSGIDIYGEPHLLTPYIDLQVLVGLAKCYPGDILELGCHRGITTRVLAEQFPERRIYAVDWTSNPSIPDFQKGELQAKQELCVKAKDKPNVTVLDMNSNEFPYSDHPGISFVFIDGDHTYEGVKADSNKAVEAMSKRGKPSCICWHDYHEVEEKMPEGLGVGRYLREELSKVRSVTSLRGTWLAFVVF